MDEGTRKENLYQMGQILCRVPVKSILRFRSLSRDLRRLIDSRQFLRLYFRFSRFRSRLFVLLFRSSDILSLPRLFVDLSYPQQEPRMVSHNPVVAHAWNIKPALIGRYQGVLCFALSAFDVYLWNPFTRTCKKLPFHSHAYNGAASRRVRFGFGPLGGPDVDFMVTRAVVSYSQETRKFFWDFSVYRLLTNTWESRGDCVQICSYFVDDDLVGHDETWWELGEPGAYSHGAVHWLVERPLKCPFPYKIILCKLDRPIRLLTMKIPTRIMGLRNSESVVSISLSSVGNNLCLTCQFSEKSNETEIWMLEKYDNHESWTRVLVLEGHFCRFKPVAFTRGRKMILLRIDSKLVLYDLRKREMAGWEVVTPDGPDIFSDAMELFECITPICGGHRLNSMHV